ncbi:unnamed protein product [Spirodela intermedia]|uniref:Uncharacterized protein n=1 Tax=Spirodela intermedia TaxID=51605 RepID=A0A7I8KW60_SPIIN|nr:unnamed protein product [Spirodela intermedia]
MMGAATAVVVVVVLSVLRPAAAVSTEERSNDMIDWLPNGPDSMEFRQYSGYLTLGLADEAQFFYYFVEAVAEDPTTKPIIFYLGCHVKLCSPLTAAFQQLGPFTVDTDGQSLLENPNSWNKGELLPPSSSSSSLICMTLKAGDRHVPTVVAANLLFLDVPASVGFSFSTNNTYVADITDYSIAEQAQQLLSLWLERFPEYRDNDIYIAGQGDIGTIGPLLAVGLLHQNKIRGSPAINLKGLIMGDPNMDFMINKISKVEFYLQMGLMSFSTYQTYMDRCANVTQPTGNGTVRGGAGFVAPECIQIWAPVDDNTVFLERFNLYTPPCPDIDIANIMGPYSFTEFVYICRDQYVAGYFSIPFVQKAIHVKSPPEMTDPPVWMPSKGGSAWTRNLQSAVNPLREVLDGGVKVLIYSGVLDYNLPIIGPQEVLSKVNLTMDTAWRPWFGKSPVEFAGYTVSYKDGLTYATLKNSGRKAAQDQSEDVYAMLSSFINNQPLPNSSYFPHP